jgi:hypothetical protein
MTNEEITERLNRIQDYEAALMKIEMYGHTKVGSNAYTCANIAEEALRKHLWKEPEAVSAEAQEHYNLDAFIETIWESTVDDGVYECKVVRNGERTGTLTVLNAITKKVLLRTPVELSYGASFGPDVHDVAYWEELCINAIDGKPKAGVA